MLLESTCAYLFFGKTWDVCISLCFWKAILLLFSFSVVSNSLQLHGLQHTKFPCHSPSPRVCSNSCPLSQWCHLILCHPLLLLPSVFPRIRFFSMNQLFASGGQSIQALLIVFFKILKYKVYKIFEWYFKIIQSSLISKSRVLW